MCIILDNSHSLNLILSKGLVACIMRNGEVIKTVVASDENAMHKLPVNGGKLLVFNTGSGDAVAA